MKLIKSLAIIFFALLLFTCSNDSSTETQPQNKAPNTFQLTTIAENASDISLTPSFSWQKASDPEGDTVLYDFFLDTNNTPSTKIGSNLTTNQFQVITNLDEGTTYYWSVTAKDDIGNSTKSSIFSFSTIQQNTNSAPQDFKLLTLADNAENTSIIPIFSWEEAIDPEQDSVTYNLALSTNENPETIIIEDLEETTYTINEALENNTNYYWKIIAKDSNGNSTSSLIFSFTTIANAPPSEFDLLAVENETTAVALLPTLIWQEAQDIDDDPILYDLYFSLESDPSLFKEDMTETTFEFSEELYLNQTYYWKIVAKDDHGNSAESEVFEFTTRGLNHSTNPLAVAANFSPRAGHTSVVFNNKIWVIGGYDGTNYYNDVWSSSDGINWTQETANAAFHSRWKHASIVYDNKIWVIAGQSDDPTDTLVDLRFSDVWYSSNGVDWTMATDGPFDERYGHTLSVFDNKMWITGGYPTNYDTDNIWQSTNGTTWTLVNDNVPYGIDLRGHNVFEFKNELWIANTYEDIWKTDNGLNWSLELEDSSFLRRVYASLESLNGNLIYFSGRATNNASTYYSDTWYSIDGENWTQGTEQTTYLSRYLHTSVIFNDKIYIIGGQNTNGYLNDVWVLN